MSLMLKFSALRVPSITCAGNPKKLVDVVCTPGSYNNEEEVRMKKKEEK